MSNRPSNLPDFDRPPLDEVALSVQFDPIQRLQTPQIGLFWSELRSAFPKTEQHPPLDPVTERFGPSPRPSVRFEISNAPPAPRCWFLKEDSTELIQVQQDRLIHNWRSLDTGDSYPRYEHVRRQFESELEAFCNFLRSEKIGEFSPNQCEVTYTNAIVSGKGWDRHGQIGRLLAPISMAYSDDFLAEPESTRFQTQYVFNDDAGKPLGRLHISCQPAFKASDTSPIYLLNMIARGAPNGMEVSDILNFIDMGREWIVRGFASITTPEMHKIWERKDVT
ncbi:MAG TPA: TIGR04255 family protein [Gammaproteobacteria bacterium]|nr:TIGR04255 family protein [Gammaproteobacteria bacterium]